MEPRTIKFRAKRKDNRKWVYGTYFAMRHNNGRGHIHYFIIPDGTDVPVGTPIERIQVEVDERTLGQFTGCRDADGRDIYEGDILSVPCPDPTRPETVVFAEGCFQADDGTVSQSLKRIDTEARVVVGNIHEYQGKAGAV